MKSDCLFQIIVRGTVDGQQGDIALDDFFYTNGVCPVSDGSEYHTSLHEFFQEISGLVFLSSHLDVLNSNGWELFLGQGMRKR